MSATCPHRIRWYQPCLGCGTVPALAHPDLWGKPVVAQLPLPWGRSAADAYLELTLKLHRLAQLEQRWLQLVFLSPEEIRQMWGIDVKGAWAPRPPKSL